MQALSTLRQTSIRSSGFSSPDETLQMILSRSGSMVALAQILSLVFFKVSTSHIRTCVLRALILLELGPCNITEDLVTQLNPYAWNEVSNMLFLSQPLGVGFSYGSKVRRRVFARICNHTEMSAGRWILRRSHRCIRDASRGQCHRQISSDQRNRHR